MEVGAQTVINALAARWDVEVFLEDYKDLLGSDQYQLMSATAIIRSWTLLSCLTCFISRYGVRESTLPLAMHGKRLKLNINAIS